MDGGVLSHSAPQNYSSLQLQCVVINRHEGAKLYLLSEQNDLSTHFTDLQHILSYIYNENTIFKCYNNNTYNFKGKKIH